MEEFNNIMKLPKEMSIKNESSLADFRGGRDGESKELYKLFLKQIAYRTVLE